jgi:hypothetical protein
MHLYVHLGLECASHSGPNVAVMPVLRSNVVVYMYQTSLVAAR